MITVVTLRDDKTGRRSKAKLKSRNSVKLKVLNRKIFTI